MQHGSAPLHAICDVGALTAGTTRVGNGAERHAPAMRAYRDRFRALITSALAECAASILIWPARGTSAWQRRLKGDEHLTWRTQGRADAALALLFCRVKHGRCMAVEMCSAESRAVLGVAQDNIQSCTASCHHCRPVSIQGQRHGSVDH